MRKSVAAGFTCSLLAIATIAGAQPATTPDVPRTTWRIAVGRDDAALRDISATAIPVDASPVSWHGTGIGVFGQHTRSRGRWTQEFTAAVSRATSFHYKAGDTTLPRPSDDRFTRVDAYYQLHRRLFSDAGFRGLSLTTGLRAGMSRTSAARHIPVDITATETRISGVTAFVLTLGFRRGRGPGLDVAWANGGHVGRLSARHSSDDASRTQWGGGWLSDLVIQGDIPIGTRTAVVARYLRSNDGTLSSHRSVASARSSLTLGVSYGR